MEPPALFIEGLGMCNELYNYFEFQANLESLKLTNNSYFSPMKFTVTITINKAREKVVEEFSNPKNLKNWQNGFLRIEPLEGEPGKTGSTSNMFYKQGNGEMVLKETILENNLPDFFKGLYEHKHMVNTMESIFTELSPTETQYETRIEYTEFIGFVPKLLAKLFPGMFKKQVLKWMTNMKNFIEKN